MTEDYSNAIDPIFIEVLELVNRIENRQERGFAEERNRVLARIRDAESQVGKSDGWPYAKYALAAWIDELLIKAPWGGRSTWAANSLEFDFFRTNIRATRFYEQAEEAERLATSDAVEVFYLCVILGFRGFYDTPKPEETARNLKPPPPPTLPLWLSGKLAFVTSKPPKDPEYQALRIAGARPLVGKFLVVGSALIFIMMVALSIVIWYYIQNTM